MKQNILVTGGCGYIGSHTVLQLIKAGYGVVVLDNLANSAGDVVSRIKKIAGFQPDFIAGDIRDRSVVRSLFNTKRIDAVIHFAGLKSVGESVAYPLKYYENNVSGSITLIEEMVRARLKTLIFSSSATVYGNSDSTPIREDFLLSPTNPYGHSKLIVENILADLYQSDPNWSIARLRYFNPVGAHESGLIGDSPIGTPNNLMPYMAQVASGARERLAVFGNDYPTQDGTGIRDYIHVEDLAVGHLMALSAMKKPGLLTLNFGTGRGYSVFELIKAFEAASSRHIPFEVVGRRPGDIAVCYADPTLAKKLLGWEAKRDIDQMCRDAWRWQILNS